MDLNADLDRIGRLLVNKQRDVALEACEGICEGRFSSPGHKAMQRRLDEFTPEQKETIKAMVAYCVDGGMNDFLHHLDEEPEVGFSVGGERAGPLRPHLLTTGGWRSRFSKYDKEGKRLPSQP